MTNKSIAPLRDVIGHVFTGMVLARQLTTGSHMSMMRIVSVKDIEDGLIAPRSALQELEFPEGSQIDRFRLIPGDVVMAARGAIKVSVATEDHAGCLAGPNLIVIRSGVQLHSALLLAFLRHPRTQDEIRRRSVGTTVPAINVDSILSLEIVVPPLSDQRKLSRIAELAERQYAVGKKIIDLRRSLAQELAIRAMSA